MNSPSPHSSPPQSGLPPWPVLVALFLFYSILRLLSLNNTYLLEDHDSILYLRQIEAYLSFDPLIIHALSPDSAPFYPFFGALMSLPGWSTEVGARLCSLVFSLLLFVALAGILKRITNPLGVAIGLGVLAVSPYLITFSISVLSEPTYVAIVYLGFWYFLAQYKSPTFRHAGGLGIVFGLSFLNRFEGLLFLALIPLLQGAYIAIERRSLWQALRPAALWGAVFAVAYLLIAVPQVLVVSDKMDRFAFNGRQVWAQLQLAPDGGSYDERIYGLKYSDEEINLTYLQRVPSDIGTEESSGSLLHMAETVLRNIDKFYSVQIGRLGGSLLIAFFLFGILELYSRKRFDDVLTIFLFLGAVLLPGLATDPKPRAVAVAVPLLAAFAGPGIHYVSRNLCSPFRLRRLCRFVPLVLLGVLLLVWIVPLLGIYLKERRENVEYSLIDLEPFKAKLISDARQRSLFNITVSSRKQYLPYLAGTEFVPLPFTDYDGLIHYCRANRVDYLFIEHRQAVAYPFLESLADPGAAAELELVLQSVDRFDQPIELYRIKSPP